MRERRCSFEDARSVPEGKVLRATFGSSDLTLELDVKPH
jgi:hypothetical protein